jgi:proton-coupled amino acid transporter
MGNTPKSLSDKGSTVSNMQTSLLSLGLKREGSIERQNVSHQEENVQPPLITASLQTPSRQRIWTESPANMSTFESSFRLGGDSLPSRQFYGSTNVPRWLEQKETLRPSSFTATPILSSSPRPSMKQMAAVLDHHLGTSAGAMNTAAASITYDLYKYSETLQERSSPKLHTRRKSESNVSIPRTPKLQLQPKFTSIGFDTLDQVVSPPSPASPPSPNLTVSQLLAPGGFRRHYVTEEARFQNRDHLPLTRNFAEFLALHTQLYGIDSDDEDVDLPSNIFYRIDETGSRVLRRFVSGQFPSGPSIFQHEEDGQVVSPLRSRPVSVFSDKETDTLLDKEVGSSPSQTYFLLLKAFVGTGILFLPAAFSDVGLAFGVAGLILMSIICCHCMLLLFSASRAIPIPSPGYGDVAEVLLGKGMRRIVQISVAASQCGFAASYLIFASQSIQQVVGFYRVVSLQQVIVVLSVALIPMVWIRNLSSLYSFLITIVANSFILLAIVYLGVCDVGTVVEEGFAWKNGKGFSLGLGPSPWTFLGTALFAFEGSAMVLPVSNAMRDSQKFPKVLMFAILTILILMLWVGAMNYVAFGDTVETIIFLNMPKGRVTQVVMSMYAMAVFLSYPLCIFPAVRILESWIFGIRKGKHRAGVKWSKNVFRSGLVVLLGILAYMSSSRLDLFVSLLGSVLIIPMGYVYPSLFSFQLGRLQRADWKVQVKNCALILFGISASIFITVQNIREWTRQ